MVPERGGRTEIVNNVTTMPRLELIPKVEFDRVRADGSDLALLADMCRLNALTP